MFATSVFFWGEGIYEVQHFLNNSNGSQIPYLLQKAGYENLTEAGDVIWVKLGCW